MHVVDLLGPAESFACGYCMIVRGWLGIKQNALKDSEEECLTIHIVSITESMTSQALDFILVELQVVAMLVVEKVHRVLDEPIAIEIVLRNAG